MSLFHSLGQLRTRNPQTSKANSRRRKRTLQSKRGLLFESLEQRFALAVTSFSSGVLSIDLNNASEAVFLGNNGTNITLTSSNAITGAGASFTTASVNRIVFSDAGSLAGQSLTFNAGTALSLASGLLGTGVETVTFNNAVTATGASALSITAPRNIAVNANITGGSGGLSLSANQQVTPTSGNFRGVNVSGATITTTGNGNVSVTGLGGDTGSDNYGVRVVSAGQITAGGSATVTVTGTGGMGTSSANYGVNVTGANSRITSSGGAVLVQGTGGGAGSSSGNFGVFVLAGGVITSAGTGSGASVTVVGQGGNTTGTDNVGVWVAGTNSQVTSSGGAVLVQGTGGGAGLSSKNFGVYVSGAGVITSAGTGSGATVTIVSQGGNTSGTGSDNYGVYVVNTAQITSSGGAVLFQGTGTSNSAAVRLEFGGSITSVSNAAITITADSVNILADSGGINSGSGTTTIRTRTAGTQINLGGDDVLSGSPLTLGLTSAELNLITAGTLVIGRNDIATGTVTVSSAIAPSGTSTLSLITGANITGSAAITETNVALRAATGISLTGANAITTVAVANTTSGGVTLQVANGVTVGTVGTLSGITANGQSVAVATTAGTITVSQAISATGTGGAVGLTTPRDIVVNANVTGGSGGLSLSANQQVAPTSGNFIGVNVSGATITTTGNGNVSVTGRGGNNSSNNEGVRVQSAGQITAGGSGTVTVTGIGGAGTGSNYGVFVTSTNSQITSSGGAVLVQGTGGGAGSSNSNIGVFVIFGGVITSAGTGNGASVTVVGQGGNTGGIGVYVALTNAQITSSGGAVLVQGTGGGAGSSGAKYGVIVQDGGVITSAGTGIGASVTVVGQGGNTSGGTLNVGVLVDGTNSQITSSGGAVLVQGTGGGAGSSSANSGVTVENAGVITSAGTGSGATVTVTGQGGNSTGTGGVNFGVYVVGTSSQITSSGGAVLVQGTGGGAGSSSANYGIYVNAAGVITSAGTGSGASVTVTGQGGNSTGAGSINLGLSVTGTNSRITSSGGAVLVQGTGTSNSEAVRLEYSGAITSGTNAAITITADSVNILANSGGINSGSGTTTIRTRTAGTQIDLGGDDDLISSPLTLGLTDAELDLITASTLLIGDANSGAIIASAVISPANYQTLDIQKGVTFSATGGFASDVTSATVFEKIKANGAIVIDTAATLTMTAIGGFIPATSDEFTIIDNTSASTTTGNFSGKPEGTLVAVAGVSKFITYVDGTTNDVVLKAATAPTVTSPTASNIGLTTATLGGTVSADGGAPITERGILLAKTSVNANPQLNGTGVTKLPAAGTTGLFTVNVTSLEQVTGYSYVAFATNSAGTTYTTVETLITAELPVITVSPDFDVFDTFANVKGTIISAGSSPITEVGFVFSITSFDATPTLGESNSASRIGTLSGNDFYAFINALPSNTSITFAAYAKNQNGTSYSDYITFTTLISPGQFPGITVWNINGTFYIYGTSQDDTISISSTAAQSITVSSNQPINGLTSPQTFTFTHNQAYYITIDTYGGGDDVTVAAPLNIEGLNVYLGTGNNRLVLGADPNNPLNNNVADPQFGTLGYLTVSGGLFVTGEDGDDRVIERSTSFAGEKRIQLGEGNNEYNVYWGFSNQTIFTSGAGQDNIFIGYLSSYAASQFDTGAGNDLISYYGSRFYNTVYLNSGAGYDTVALDVNIYDQAVTVDTGSEGDYLLFSRSIAYQSVSLTTSSGADTVLIGKYISGLDNFGRALYSNGGSNIDQFSLTTGVEADTVQIAANVMRQFYAALGDALDFVDIEYNIFTDGLLDGGERGMRLRNKSNTGLRTINIPG